MSNLVAQYALKKKYFNIIYNVCNIKERFVQIRNIHKMAYKLFIYAIFRYFAFIKYSI